MKRYVLFLLLMIAYVQVKSQNFTLPIDIVDSMVFEVKKGRRCDDLQRKQQIEIEKLGKELLIQEKMMDLQNEEKKTLGFIVENLNSTIKTNNEKTEIEKNVLKRKIGKLWIGISLEGVGILLLLLLL